MKACGRGGERFIKNIFISTQMESILLHVIGICVRRHT